MKFITVPNLPQNKVDKVIVSAQISKHAQLTLEHLGICVLKTMKHPNLYSAVAYHADMQLHHLGSDEFVCEPYAETYYRALIPFPNIRSGKRISEKYPQDIAYNAARVGRYLICKQADTSSIITESAEKSGLTVIDVKQGYSKCNICVIDENSVITSDKGIAKALGNFEIDVLLTDDSCVKLQGLNHGFLGGATGKISRDVLAVNGNINYHTNRDEIISFVEKRGVKIVSLCDGVVEDIGSIIPISEN